MVVFEEMLPLARRILVGIALVIVASSDAKAQAGAADAQELFEQAKKLVADGRVDVACPMLEESQRLDPSPGTLFHLADCYERQGRTASAWAGFVEVTGVAHAAGRTAHETLARQRASSLEPRLTRLRIVVPEARSISISIEKDGAPLGRGAFGTDVPVDPGRHVVRATAPGSIPWRVEVDARGEGHTTVVEVPSLEPVSAPPPPTRERVASLGTQRTIAVVLGGVGVVGMGVGTYLGLDAIALNRDSRPHCHGNACDARGVELRADAVDAGHASTLAFAVAATLVAGAVILWITAPSARAGTRVAALRGEIRF